MEWIVRNAISRDVERQQLNKILKEIHATIADVNARLASSNSAVDDSKVRSIVANMLSSGDRTIVQGTYNTSTKGIDFAVRNFTIALTGDVTGSGLSQNLGNVSVTTTATSGGVSEAPFDGLSYWRNSGQWVSVPYPLETLGFLEPPGILVLDGDLNWHARSIEGTAGRIVVTNGDGVADNPTIDLETVPNGGDGVFQLFFRDAYGRVVATTPGDSDDVPEGTTNLYFTDERAQDAVGSILSGPMSVLLSYTGGLIVATLDGDVLAPGPSKFYATDALGVNGWVEQPPVELIKLNGFGVAGGYLRSNGAEWERVSSIPKADVGLGNVDNTSDMDKPVSTAQAAAIAAAETTTGVYTPTLTNVANVTASSANPVTYMRKDNVVFLSGSVSITPTLPSVDTRVRISIPIPSDFTTGEQANGVCTIQTDTGTGNLTSNPTFDNIVVQILPSTAGGAVRVFFMGAYEIL